MLAREKAKVLRLLLTMLKALIWIALVIVKGSFEVKSSHVICFNALTMDMDHMIP